MSVVPSMHAPSRPAVLLILCLATFQGSFKKPLSAEEARLKAEELVRRARERRERDERETAVLREKERIRWVCGWWRMSTLDVCVHFAGIVTLHVHSQLLQLVWMLQYPQEC